MATQFEIGSKHLIRQALPDEVTLLALDLLILLWAGGVITGEVKVAQSSTRSGHDLLELVPEAVLLLVVAFTVVIPVVIVIFVGGVELLPLGAICDEVGGVATLEQPLGDLLLALWNLCRAWNFLAYRAISSSGMLLYCSSEVVAKEDKANSKVDEIVVLVGLASWPPTWALVIHEI
jgi:hypothetical protein